MGNEHTRVQLDCSPFHSQTQSVRSENSQCCRPTACQHLQAPGSKCSAHAPPSHGPPSGDQGVGQGRGVLGQKTELSSGKDPNLCTPLTKEPREARAAGSAPSGRRRAVRRPRQVLDGGKAGVRLCCQMLSLEEVSNQSPSPGGQRLGRGRLGTAAMKSRSNKLKSGIRESEDKQKAGSLK